VSPKFACAIVRRGGFVDVETGGGDGVELWGRRTDDDGSFFDNF